MSEKKNALPDLKTLSRSELLDLLDKLSNDLQSINLQLNDAKAKAATKGVYADSEWWYKANRAQIIVTGHIRKVERRLSVLKDEKRHKKLSDYFMEAARFHLKGETYRYILEDARARMESAQE